MTKRIPLAALVLLGPALAEGAVDTGVTAWMLVSTAMVLLMTPALAFFYGGLVGQKNVLNTMAMSFAAMAAGGVAWALLGYSLAYAEGSAFVGGLGYAFLQGFLEKGKMVVSDGMPALLDVAFQGTFAIITAALVSGSLVGRMRFSAWLVFSTLWILLVYAPLAHWVWGDGLLSGALDFAGGTVVHINAAVAGLVGAIVLGPRREFGRVAFLPHNIPFVLLGAGLLWFGWFGFNGGSAYGANASAALAFTNTFLAPAMTALVWIVLDYLASGKATAVGIATAIVVGLVAITPAAGYVGPLGALWIGAIAAFPSFYFIRVRPRLGLDDSLDVFGAHGLGGITGAILTGVFASAAWGGTAGGLEGNWAQVLTQVKAVVYATVYSALGTAVLLYLTRAFVPLRVSEKDELVGLDAVLHGEEAYPVTEGAILVAEEGGKR